MGNLQILADKLGIATSFCDAGANKQSYKVDDNTTRKLYVNKINNTGLGNKNRAEYYLRFKNSTNNQLYVMKVYSYIIDHSTGTPTVYISEPEYINLYDIANCIYNIS